MRRNWKASGLVVGLLCAEALNGQTVFPPLNPLQLKSYDIEVGGGVNCSILDDTRNVPLGQALPLYKQTCNWQFQQNNDNSTLTSTTQLTAFSFTEPAATPAITRNQNGDLIFASPWNRTLNIEANWTVTSSKPLSQPVNGVFDVYLQDSVVPPGQPPPKFTSSKVPNAGGTVPVKFTQQLQYQAWFVEVTSDGQFITNRTVIDFQPFGNGVIDFQITVTAKYAFTPAVSVLQFVDGSLSQTPASGLDLSKPLTATVKYDLSTIAASMTQLSLRIYDTADPNKRLLQGASDFVNVSRTDASPQRTLTIDPADFHVDPALTSVYLIATIVNPSLSNPVLAETAPVQLTVLPVLTPVVKVIQVTQEFDNSVPMVSDILPQVLVYPVQAFRLGNLVKNLTATISASLVNPDGTKTPLPPSITTVATTALPELDFDKPSPWSYIMPTGWFPSNAGFFTLEVTAKLNPRRM